MKKERSCLKYKSLSDHFSSNNQKFKGKLTEIYLDIEKNIINRGSKTRKQ